MYQLKSNRVEDNKEVVHFSDNQTFYYQGILFKVFKTGSTHPKAPTLALLKVDTDSRVSGLFKIGSNLYQGDTKSEKGKVYFRLKFLERNTIELTNFNTALIQGGFITPEAEINPFIEPYSPSNESFTGVGLVSGKSEQLNITSEPIL